MTENQQAAYIVSQSVCALIKAMGMMSANQAAVQKGEPPVHSGEEFDLLIEAEGIHSNAVIGWFNAYR